MEIPIYLKLPFSHFPFNHIDVTKKKKKKKHRRTDENILMNINGTNA